MLKYVAEFIGTFVLLSAILRTGSALPIGMSLMVAAAIFGPVSGGNFNPAVSFTMLLDKQLTMGHFVPYVVAQVAGAYAALLFYKKTSK